VGVPFIQQYRVARYVISQKLRRRERYPLVLMLEPLFRCNLACSGCGKIDYPEEILKQRLSMEACLSAVEECGAPVVSIAGGEPMLHSEMPQIVAALVKRKKFVYFCTNGLLLKTLIENYTPSPYLTFSVHVDGNRERHDALAGQEGVYDRAVEGIRFARSKGFRVTVNCTLYDGATAQETAEFFDSVMELGADGMMISPGFGYTHAPKDNVFLRHEKSKELFRSIFKLGRGRRWKFNHSSLFLDFLSGNQNYRCTPWGNPTYNVLGWQRPCYLLVDEGSVPTFKALMEETNWEGYGRGRHRKCSDCMLHSGFEPTAVNDAMRHPLKAFFLHLWGPRTDGPMVSEEPRIPSECPSARSHRPARQ
jgi:hopanoid biosynthesis associated radical SAM protein HpnH